MVQVVEVGLREEDAVGVLVQFMRDRRRVAISTVCFCHVRVFVSAV